MAVVLNQYICSLLIIQSTQSIVLGFETAISSLEKYDKAPEQDLRNLTVKETVDPFPFITEYGAEKIKFTHLSRLG